MRRRGRVCVSVTRWINGVAKKSVCVTVNARPMSFGWGTEMSVDVYNTALTAISIVIVLFGGWLVVMMMARMIALRAVTPPDIASLAYVLSSVLVFFVIAARMLWSWPREATLFIVLLKMVSVIGVSLWFYLGPRKERP